MRDTKYFPRDIAASKSTAADKFLVAREGLTTIRICSLSEPCGNSEMLRLDKRFTVVLILTKPKSSRRFLRQCQSVMEVTVQQNKRWIDDQKKGRVTIKRYVNCGYYIKLQPAISTLMITSLL